MPVGLTTSKTQPATTRRRGIAIPFAVTKAGGLALVEGDDQDDKVIRTALLSTDNNNAWLQTGGLGEKALFATMDDRLKAELFSRIRRVFDDFKRQKRFQLVADSLTVLFDQDAAEVQVALKYHNLESDTLKSFAMILGGA